MSENDKKKLLGMDKGWQWLVYLDFIFPLVLLILALLPLGAVSNTLAKYFHAYNIYIINTLPHIPSGTGIAGILIHAGILFYTLIKKQYKDFFICLGITGLNILYFSLEWNYILTGLLPIMSQ